MKSRPARDRILALVMVLIILLIDFFTKRWAIQNLLNEIEEISVIPGVLRFRFAWNKGVAFSFLSDRPMIVVIFTMLILTVIALFLFLPKKEHPADRILLSMIFAGGLGNLVDRALYGAVADFIEFTFMSFPVFNFADICVVLGTVLYALRVLVWNQKKGGVH